jgi:hypothetical protein
MVGVALWGTTVHERVAPREQSGLARKSIKPLQSRFVAPFSFWSFSIPPGTVGEKIGGEMRVVE